MSKNFNTIIVAILALLGGAILAAVFIKKKMTKDKDVNEEYDDTVDDEEFEQFFREDEAKEDECESTSDDESLDDIFDEQEATEDDGTVN